MEKGELDKLIAHYDERADHYYTEYMFSGNPSTERAYYRNTNMADALRLARASQDTKRKLTDIKIYISSVDASDQEKAADMLRFLQREIDEGRL